MDTDPATPPQESEATSRLRVAIALTGQRYSRSFLLSLMTTLHTLWESQKIQVILSPGHADSSVHERMRAWGMPPHRGTDAVPLDGAFDVLVSLGPDVVFRSDQFIELIEGCVREHPVLAGIVRGPTVETVQVADTMDLQDLATKEQFAYWTVEKMQALQAGLHKKQEAKEALTKEDLFHRVEYASLQFMAIRRDVFDNVPLMTEPLFYAPPAMFSKEEGKTARYVFSDDEAFCYNLRRAGIPLYVHAGLTVNVERPVLF